MKKTLIITLEYPPQIGGIATYVEQYARSLPSDQMIVLAPSHTDAVAWDSAQPYQVVRSPLLFRGPIWPKWFRLLFVVRGLVRKHGIEQIHVHHLLPVGYVTYLLKKTCTYAIFLHGTDLVRLEGKRWKTYWARKVVRHAVRIIVNSTSLRDRAVQTFSDSADRVHLVYPCPDHALTVAPSAEVLQQLRAQLGLEHRQVILTVSRFDDGKGIPQMVKAVAQLVPQHPNMVWILIGDGKKKPLVLDLIQKYRLQNIVRYLGALPHAALHPYYYLADVFALLTHPDSARKDEGFGIVFLEAAAAGIPAVAGNSGGTKEAVIHLETGLVVNPYNDMEVTGALSRLLRDEPLRRSLGDAAKARVLTTFTWDTQLNQGEPWL